MQLIANKFYLFSDNIFVIIVPNKFLNTGKKLKMKSTFEDGDYFEYTKAANPNMPPLMPQVMDPHLNFTKTQISTIDLSKELEINYPATSPNCLVNFVHILAKDKIACSSLATSNLFVVIQGSGVTQFDSGELSWKQHDVFVIPYDKKIEIQANDDAILYWVHDEPILNYLGVAPINKTFNATLFEATKFKNSAQQYNSEAGASERNRNGVLFGNKACPLTKTITPSLWALFNIIEPHTIQLPHRHNSVALDLSLMAKPGVYTLMGQELDDRGNIKDPQRFDWGNGVAFITPPGWWHAHINESDEEAYVLPVQDAGLHTYMRTLFIQFFKK